MRLAVRLAETLWLDAFRPAVGRGLAKIAGTTIPRRRLSLVTDDTPDPGAGEKSRIESGSQPHSRRRVSRIRCALVEEARRGDVARGEERVAASHERGGLLGGGGRYGRGA